MSTIRLLIVSTCVLMAAFSYSVQTAELNIDQPTAEKVAIRFLDALSAGPGQDLDLLSESQCSAKMRERIGADRMQDFLGMLTEDFAGIDATDAVREVTANGDNWDVLVVNDFDQRYLFELSLSGSADPKISGIMLDQLPLEVPNVASKGIAAAAEKYLADRVAKNDFSGSVLLAKNNDIIFAHAFGLADVEALSELRPSASNVPIRYESTLEPIWGQDRLQFVHPGPVLVRELGRPRAKSPLPMNDCDIHVIAEELNVRSDDYAIGGLQELRKTIKHFSRRPGKHIFSDQTTHDGWAFHHGGRSELQFNIGHDGSDGSMLRHGIAFSFETSRTLPTIDPLRPKVRLFNDFLQLYLDIYADMRMWHFDQQIRSDEYMPGPIPSERVKEGVFLFLGKRFPIKQLDYRRILMDFDRLLPLYRYVESNGALPPVSVTDDHLFSFTPGCTNKPGQTVAHLARDPINISLRHNVLQEALYRSLVAEYGAENVGTELSSGVGTRVDVVLRRSDSFWFYEIKTAHSPRACIREAMGQLLEYSYWPKAQEAEKLIVVGEKPLDTEGVEYLSLLRKKFRLPIEYENIDLAALESGGR